MLGEFWNALVKILSWKFPVQTPLGARPGFEIQPRYEASGNLQVEINKTQWLTSG